MSAAVCEMLHVFPGADGMGAEFPCTNPRAGVTEDGTPVCVGCGKGMKGEGFRVDWDEPVAPAESDECKACRQEIRAP
jgi:hypothetical protein